MTFAESLALMLDPTRVLRAQGMPPDPWQRELLLGTDPCVLLNCSRQSGKSTTVAALAVHQLLARPGALVLLVSPSERQSCELYRKVLAGVRALGDPVSAKHATRTELELATGSRLVALPGREDTIRSYSGVSLLILDEASRVPDDLYRSVRPMLAVSRGRLVALSTPFGQRGWFYDEWVGAGPWKKVHVPWTMCPRITPAFIDEERRAMGPAWVDQEYGGCFITLEGRVYPEFDDAIVDDVPTPSPHARSVGGVDFGWHNPFAAVWGFVDAGVLWITNEHYQSRGTIKDHSDVLPKSIEWIADPSGGSDFFQLRQWGYHISKGDNAIREGIARVAGRLRAGTLKVHRRCEHLIAESRLYRYPTKRERAIAGENPIDEHNHALAAVRYLVSKLKP